MLKVLSTMTFSINQTHPSCGIKGSNRSKTSMIFELSFFAHKAVKTNKLLLLSYLSKVKLDHWMVNLRTLVFCERS